MLKMSGKKFKLPAAKEGWTFEPRPGDWYIATGPSGRRVRLAAIEVGSLFFASIPSAHGTLLWNGEIQKEKSYLSGAHSGSDSDWVAQFPGKVRKILVSPGATVNEGEPLLLVEAMKMEFPVKAPYDCKIVKILVQENQQLSPGDRFFDIEVLSGG